MFLINSWRMNWGQDKMYFYIVQLAPHSYKLDPHILPTLWEAQTKAARDTPDCDLIVINDLGDLKDVHPRRKSEVGRRLTIAVMNKTYGDNHEVYQHPEFKSYKIVKDKVIIEFSGAKGLRTRDGKSPNWFEIAGENGHFYPAKAEIEGTKVIVSAPKVAVPKMVRFAWHMTAQPNLINNLGYPANSFRAGNNY